MEIYNNSQIISYHKLGFTIYDVSVESIMNIAKTISLSESPLDLKRIMMSFPDRSKKYIIFSLKMAVQLKLIDEDNSTYRISENYRNDLNSASIIDLPIVFRKALQSFPPFVLYVSLISKGFPSDNASQILRGVVDVSTSDKTIAKMFRNWGLKSKLIVAKNNTLTTAIGDKGFSHEYIKSLIKALDNDMTAKVFLIDILGNEIFGYLSKIDVDISSLASSLLDYEKDPKQSLKKSIDVLETFIHKYGSDNNIDVKGLNGINALVNRLFEKQLILQNHKNIGNGIGGLRNITGHGVDKDTQDEWDVTKQSALSGILLVPIFIKSLYLYLKYKQQTI